MVTSVTSVYVRLPHRPGGGAPTAETWQLGPVRFALVREDAAQTILRQGQALPDDLPAADRLILIFAASDVWTAEIPVPPLAKTKLRQALPHLVEDRLAGDPLQCHIATRTAAARGAPQPQPVAAIDRAWFRHVLGAFSVQSHRRLLALAAQHCLPTGPGDSEGPTQPSGDPVLSNVTTVAIETTRPADATLAAIAGNTCDITVRPATGSGYGLQLAPESLPLWLAMAGSEVRLLAPATEAATLAAATGHRVEPLDWPVWIAGTRAALASASAVDLCQFEFAGEAGGARLWQAWRVPVALAAGLLLVQVIGMNTHWLMLRQQKNQLVAGMEQTLRDAFPRTPVIVDAPLQMRREVEQLRLASGKSGPDDFLPLADRFAQAAATLPPDGLLALDYRGKTLRVTLKDGLDTAALRTALRTAGLSMSPADAPQASPPADRPAPAGAVPRQGSHWTVALAS
ncbi:type II secretion system protein GspL [Imbroritus primus]|uniref:type II secretion system protein GspL n=1 Tax=Imbroritus primus TaxID=3058603 RepID=UPI003D162346